jgi:LacI family sucrose operon transcriptional repressor
MTPTIKQIAKMAGVSKTTVSLVVNGKSKSGRISSGTEKKVLEIVRKVGYSPNMMARGFRLNRSQTIGFVVPDVRNPFFAELNYTLEQIARLHGYQILIGCSDDNKTIEQEVVNNLLSYSIEGLIVASVLNEKQLLVKMYNRKVPVVFIDREIALKNISSVSSDNYQGAYDAVQVLIDEGAREIAYIGGLPDLSTSRSRYRGYLDALKANRISLNRELVFQKDYTPADGYNMIEEIFNNKKGNFPEALFTSSYTLLEGVLQFVKNKTGAIPPTLKIATFDDHPLLDYLPNKIVSVKQDCRALAQNAFDLLEASFEKPAPPVHIRVRPRLTVRS